MAQIGFKACESWKIIITSLQFSTDGIKIVFSTMVFIIIHCPTYYLTIRAYIFHMAYSLGETEMIGG